MTEAWPCMTGRVWSINSQTRRSQEWSIFYTLLPYIQLGGTEHWWLHDCKIEKEGEFKWKWERDDDQPRFQCNPVLPHDPSHFLFSCFFFSQFSSHPLQSNRAQRPDAVRCQETGLFEIITNPDLRSHPVPLTCRAPSCMSHLNRPLAGYRHCCRCFLCHRFLHVWFNPRVTVMSRYKIRNVAVFRSPPLPTLPGAVQLRSCEIACRVNREPARDWRDSAAGRSISGLWTLVYYDVKRFQIISNGVKWYHVLQLWRQTQQRIGKPMHYFAKQMHTKWGHRPGLLWIKLCKI